MGTTIEMYNRNLGGWKSVYDLGPGDRFVVDQKLPKKTFPPIIIERSPSGLRARAYAVPLEFLEDATSHNPDWQTARSNSIPVGGKKSPIFFLVNQEGVVPIRVKTEQVVFSYAEHVKKRRARSTNSGDVVLTSNDVRGKDRLRVVRSPAPIIKFPKRV